MTTTELELKRLIYGQSNTIVLSGFNNYFDALKEIELVRGTMAIEGYIFKSNFADSKKLKKFTEADWAAMFAQYALTYGWSDKYQHMTGTNALETLQDYVDNDPEPKFKMEGTTSPDIYYTVEPVGHYKVVLQDIANSKTVLREQQLRIINLMPIEVVESVYKDTTFTIKETEILFIKRLIDAGSKVFSFTEPDQIVRFLVSNFRSNGEQVTGQLNKTILKDVQLKIPTSFKKKVWKDLDAMKLKFATSRMKKYLQFWKRIFKQIKFGSNAQMYKRYTQASKIRNVLFTDTIATRATEIERYKMEGNYDRALLEELRNPGQMLRGLLQYLRYKTGDKLAKKLNVKLPKEATVFTELLGKKVKGPRTVQKDVHDVLNSVEFYDALLAVNTKLLWQVYGMVKKSNERIFEPRSQKIVNKTKIAYSTPLPGLDKELTKIARKRIKNAIKQIKREENSKLGNVYIDPDVANFPIQFSGRDDTSLSLSGQYLPTGSRIDLDQIIPDKDLSKSMLRIGLAWRGSSSCDIDLSMNVDDYGAVYYGRNVMERGGEIIAASSGDITSCSSEIFSTEFIDIDLEAFTKHGFSKMFNSAVIYSGSTFKSYECFWFMSVIKKKDRVSPGRKVKMKLDEMDYAVQITEDAKTMIGLMFNIEEGYAEVANIPMKSGNYQNAAGMDTVMREAMEGLPPRQTIADALAMAVNKQQIVDDSEFADIVISTRDEIDISETAEYIHPGRHAIRLQELLF